MLQIFLGVYPVHSNISFNFELNIELATVFDFFKVKIREFLKIEHQTPLLIEALLV